MVDITVRPETGVDMGACYSPVAEAEQIAAEATARMPGERFAAEPLHEQTLSAFRSVVETNAKAADLTSRDGLFFSAFHADTERTPDLHIGFDWIEPSAREPESDGRTLAGSLFFARQAPGDEEGLDVMSYSMWDGPDGPTIEGRVGRYDGVVTIDNLSTRSDAPNAAYAPEFGAPAITNDEIMGAVDTVGQALSDSWLDFDSFDAEVAALSAEAAPETAAAASAEI